jgi:ApbE superfamily uncharacterized protein (UPF0280 family)
MYRERTYREHSRGKNLVFFRVVVEETDLMIGANKPLLKEAETIVKKYRSQIQSYIIKHPEFHESLVPLAADADAPLIIKRMCQSAQAASVGPMAAVAGAISEMAGNELLSLCSEIIVENGGDIFLKTNTARRVGVFAGKSPFSEKIAIDIQPHRTPIGVCTSSGTVGHSLSFGKADAVVIISKDTFLADAVATAICNRIQSDRDFEEALEYAMSINGVEGALAILDDKMAARGNIRLVPYGHSTSFTP